MTRCLVFCLLLNGLFCTGQNMEVIRRMKQDLTTAKGKDQFTLLTDLAWEYRAFNPDSSIYFATRAYSLGQSINVKKSLARPLNFIGLAHNHSGDNLDAFEYYNRAVATASQQNDSLQLAHAYNNIGRLFTEQGLYNKSYPYLTRSLAIFSGMNDSSGIAYSYQSLGAVSKVQNNFPAAEYNFEKAYQIRLHLKSTREIVSAMIQVGKLYLDQNKNDKAIHYFELADSAAKVIQDGIAIAEVKTFMAECLVNKGDLVNAERMGKEGLDYILQSANIRLLPEAYLTMGRVKFKRGDFLEAKTYFEKALEISSMRKDLNSRMEAHFFLWQTYRQQNNYKEELANQNQYLILKDSVKTLESIQREQKFQFEREIDKREQENELLRANELRNRYIITILIVLFFSASWLLYAQWKHRKRIQRFSGRLEERNVEIGKINGLLNLKNTTLEDHINTLLSFSKNRSIGLGDLSAAARDIVKVTARSLKTSRVSIWVYYEERQCIESMACYDADKDSFLPQSSLQFSEAPGYFNALKTEKVIAANDAGEHHYTREFSESYLIPLNIRSMLDATFFLDGELKGLLCCEHKDAMRHWTAEDIIFASSVSDIISLAFRNAQRLEYEKQIRHQSKEIALMNEVLEDRVKERTEVLENQNARLSEYAFINSHLLRGPLSRILGLINLMEHDKTMKQETIIELLRKSGDDLDNVVRKITDTLHQGGQLKREDII